MNGSRRAFYGGSGDTLDPTAIHITGVESAEGVKTFVDGIQVGTDEIRAVIGDLGDTQGIWVDLTLGGGTNPVQHLKLRAKGAGSEIQLHSPTDALEGLSVDGVDVVVTDDARLSSGAQKSANLSDLASVATARTNLGLGGAAQLAVGTAAGTVAAGDDSRIVGAAQKSANLSDLANVGTARTNLGLGDAAVLDADDVLLGANNLSDVGSAETARTNLGLGGAAQLAVGTGAGTVAAGDDSRITGAAQKSANLSDLANAGTARTNLGLGSVNNTSDADKPISTAAQAALDAKQALDSDLTAIAALTPSNDDVVQRKGGVWTNRTPAQVKTDLALVAGDVGLGNVTNTSDANKPVSTAQQTALDAKLTAASNLSDVANAGTARTNLGLGTAAVLASSAVAQTANNLSDLASAATARTNLGVSPARLFAILGSDHPDITSDTTLQNVTGLSVAVAANKVYKFEVTAYFDAGPTGDSKWGLTYPASSSGRWSAAPAKNAADTATNFTSADISATLAGGAVNSGTVMVAVFTGILRTTASGTLQVQVAQNATDGTALKVKTNTHLSVWEVA